MPIVNGTYRQLTEDEIQAQLEDELRAEFGADIDLTQSSVFSTLTTVLAAVLSENQEQSLEEIYEAAFLDTATGIDLERVVSIIGIQRRAAVHATGVQRFIGVEKATNDAVIPRGTTVQTTETTPVQFETREPSVLKFIDSFEDDNLQKYSGDVANGSVVADSDATEGDNVLTLDPTTAFIYDGTTVLNQGGKYHCNVRLQTDTQAAVVFGIDPDDTTNHYQIVCDDLNSELRLERVDGGTTTTIGSKTVSFDTNSFYEVEYSWNITNNIGVSLYDSSDTEIATIGAEDDTYQSGYVGFKSLDSTAKKSFDWFTMSEVSANIRAVDGGAAGNVGANSIQQLVSPPSNIDRSTNIYPTGDNSYKDINGNRFLIGQEKETDEELRNRASDAVTGGGDATHEALVNELSNNVDNVSSVRIFENKTDNDNRPSGLPPHSFEAVVYGGTDEQVANAIFRKKAVTARDYGGINGTESTFTVVAESNGEERTISWSRPTKVDIDMTLDIIIDDSYVGDNSIRDQIVEYIGGTLSTESETIGLGVGDNVVIDRIRDIVVGEENGVVGFDKSVDGSPIETTPSYTTIDGLETIDIGGSDVAQANATDASIVINAREQ
jgi:hypothetical protein